MNWVLAQIGGLSHFRPASLETVLTEGVLFRLWVFGSLLNDGIHCHATEGCRISRLDDVTNESSPCHRYWRAVDAVSCWGRQHHRGSVASHGGVPQGDWSKNWWRQVSGIIHSVHFVSLTFFTPSSCCFLFRRRESMAIFTSIRWPAATSAWSIWFSRSVSLTSCTFLILLTLVRRHSGQVGKRFQETCGKNPGFLILGRLVSSRRFHFYARGALSRPPFWWLGDSCGLLSFISVCNSQSWSTRNFSFTASSLFNFTGLTRKFEYHC